jgi:hypothetical protein
MSITGIVFSCSRNLGREGGYPPTFSTCHNYERRTASVLANFSQWPPQKSRTRRLTNCRMKLLVAVH